MALQIRKVRESQRSVLVPTVGELLYITDSYKLYVGDGITRGGVYLLDGISFLEYIDADIEHSPPEDGDFVYWNASTSRWVIGKRYKSIFDLEDTDFEEDVTNAENNQIFIYNSTLNKWILQFDKSDEVPLKDFEDVSGDPVQHIDINNLDTQYASLQYNSTSEKWDIIELPAAPTIEDMEEVVLSANVELGHMLFIDPTTQKYVNDYANQDLAPAYNCGLFQIENKDIIKFSSSSGKFINHTPKFAEDVAEVSVSNVETWTPSDQIYSVMIFGENVAFAINNERAHNLEAFKNRKLIFDLSNASLTGLNLKFSAQPDGTHSLDPVGTIWSSTLVTETGTPGIDGRVEIDLPTYFAEKDTSSYWNNTETDPDKDPVYVIANGDDEIPELTFTVLGSVPDPNATLEDQESGQGNVEDGEIEEDFPGLFYFSPENQEYGAKIKINDPEPLSPFTLLWDANASGFNVSRFDLTVSDMDDVVITPDQDGFLFDNQMLSFDSSTEKWTTPLDKVVGLGISSSLPRRFEEFANMLWAGGSEGLGEFTYSMPANAELESITINLNELEIEGSDEDFDTFFFDTEEDREYFYELIEEAQTQDIISGGNGTLSRQVYNDLAEDANARVMRIRTRKKAYSRTGRSKSNNSQETAEVYAEYSQNQGAGGGGGLFAGGPNVGGSGLGGGFGGLGGNGRESASGAGFGGDGWTGSAEGQSEPGLEDLIASEEFPDPAATAEAFVEAYTNFGNNVKQIFGVMLARNRAFEALMPKSTRDPGSGSVANSTLDASDRFSNELQLQFNYIDVSSDPTPPQMFGWRQSTDTYGYYYFTFAQRNSQLTFNTRNHELIAHSYMRRVGCTHGRGRQFQVEFYYDADDSTKMAGEWLRIVEFQSAQSAYNGQITEVPSTTIRQDLEEWSEVVLYRKGNRVLYQDKVWECLVRTTKGFPPASGTASVPNTVTSNGIEYPVAAFVEIQKFSVKSQRFEGVYQLRTTFGSNTQGGLTHPAFRFSEDAGDEADYLYVGAMLMNSWGPSKIDYDQASYVNFYTATRDQIKTYIDSQFWDNGMYLFDINVHSLLQHLMVSEFQTMNLEKALGEDNNTFTSAFPDEHNFIKNTGNGSGFLLDSNDPANGGCNAYRGIHRVYGSAGYHIDGMNVDPATREVYYQVDNFLYDDETIQPEGYLELHPLPDVPLSTGDGQDWIRDFWNFIEADFRDFVYYLPRYVGGGRELYLADQIFYRDMDSVPSGKPAKCVIGKNNVNRTNSLAGAFGPHSLTVANNPIAAARLIVRRKGAALVPSTQGSGVTKTYGNLFNSDNEILISEIPQPDPADLAAGDYWVADFVLEKQQPVVGASSITGKTGARTMSLARLLASKSALCIGITDESDAQTFDGMQTKWGEFRELFPSRVFNVLCPTNSEFTLQDPAGVGGSGGGFHPSTLSSSTDMIWVSKSDFTNPLSLCAIHKNTVTIPFNRYRSYRYSDDASVERGVHLDVLFPSITNFFPSSENARTSYPLTYAFYKDLFTQYVTLSSAQSTYVARDRMAATQSNGGYTDFLKENAVTIFNVLTQQVSFSDHAQFPRTGTSESAVNSLTRFPSHQGRKFTLVYKIRIPAYTSTTTNQVSDGLFFKYACDGNLTVKVYNPYTDTTHTVVENYSNYNSNGQTSYTGSEVVTNFSPLQIFNQDTYLNLIVEFTNDTGSESWFDNPGLFALNIYINDLTDGASNPHAIPIFIAQDYTSPFTSMYGSPTGEPGHLLRQPINHMMDAYNTLKSNGPFIISRDNGDTRHVTDIFELCNLGNAVPGTLLGLFVDRSGSMVQGTIQASYDLLYQKCALAQIEIVEVQNATEDWITPFIQEI